MSDGLDAKPSPSVPFDKRSGGLGVDRARAGAGKAPSRHPPLTLSRRERGWVWPLRRAEITCIPPANPGWDRAA
jgi:hypothetical protein